MRHAKKVTAAITVAACLAAFAAGGLIFIYSGLYNVAAIEPDSAIVDWALSSTMDSSVHRHAKGVTVPADFERMDLREGGSHYREMCVTCHGGPGVEASELAEGLNPPAPDLKESASDWSPAELYWIIRNGVKMTGI